MDNLSVFFLAEGEQSGDDVMTRLVTFIRAAKQTLAFAIYDMRLSDPLRAQLAAALRERADAGVQIRFCYDADKPPQPDLAAGQDPAPAGTGAFVQITRLPLAAHRGNETDAQQIRRARRRSRLDWLGQHDGRRLHFNGKQHCRNRLAAIGELLR